MTITNGGYLVLPEKKHPANAYVKNSYWYGFAGEFRIGTMNWFIQKVNRLPTLDGVAFRLSIDTESRATLLQRTRQRAFSTIGLQRYQTVL